MSVPRLIHSALILLMFYVVGFSQQQKTTPKLLGYFGPDDDDVLNGIYKLEQTLEGTFNSREDIFAVRVCSDDPLTVALAISKGAPFLAVKRLAELGIPKSNMYYLRQSENCKLMRNDYALTEYWLIPKHAELPEFVEAVRATHLSGYQLTQVNLLSQGDPTEIRASEWEKLTPRSYRAVLDRSIQLLKQNKSAVIVLRAPYYKRSLTVELNKRIGRTQQYLKDNGIASHRIYLRRIYAGVIKNFSTDAPKYPDIIVIGEGLEFGGNLSYNN